MTQIASQPVTLEYMQGSFERLGREVGQKIADKLGTAIASRVDDLKAPNRPVTFKGGVSLAKFSAGEATEIAEHFELIGEYANDAENLARSGLTLESFVESRLADEHGFGMAPGQGYQAAMSSDFKAALAKQSAEFAAKFPARTGSLADGMYTPGDAA
jgi:hypothetical protein